MAINGFAEWLETPLGKYVLAWEQRKLDILLADIFGFNAVQVGFPHLNMLRANRMPFHVLCCDRGGVMVQSDPRFLPFASNSIDLIVLPHVLEFNANPHQVLREVERVLVPEGSVVVIGFNPYSFWGLRRAIARHAGRPPWQGRYLSVPRLRDWFTLLGFETRSGAFGCYIPPVRQEKWLKRWRFMDAAGDRWWPIAGGVYVVQAIKRQQGMRLIMPKWHERMAAARAMAAVTRKPLTQKTKEQ
ncbi:MAG: class I SAM-dependent methyltransferase [Gammaproteobacteria bacterium]|nr:class I SAM-dependent methyltransferase [Rhodocyclaceae bacterium]MBU3908586.1 class I SAM-dependent methyltransferase [Gammaproteobacteria bacterium]MBU3990467.1 class I SAM-dependent methyltransferase [Gammaproteobacteria bacterium]MBU4004614.1 class I SAM-dependent methyltransferase [Gammaproteobacteria bacterium]MBU4021217.1 class I SAM-dependent methyltransferase [Gammaproteobacteria bacterium]